MFAPMRKHCTHLQFAHPAACSNFTVAISVSSALANASASVQQHEEALARGAKLEHSKVQESKAKQSKAKQSKAKQSKAKQSTAKQSKAKHSKAQQSKAKQCTATGQSTGESAVAKKSIHLVSHCVKPLGGVSCTLTDWKQLTADHLHTLIMRRLVKSTE